MGIFFELLLVRFLAKFRQKKFLRIVTVQYSIVKLAITVRSGMFFIVGRDTLSAEKYQGQGGSRKKQIYGKKELRTDHPGKPG
ncbi:MAG: hypothetical protein D3917_05740 [Candidatus Electrothrix sp. AX5]|nr:hypothetical protein [Candidatus Electrothrix sp. AX5]